MAINEIHIFPASGYRSPDAGKLINSGTWGYEWASTLGASGVWGLNFSPAGLGLWDFGRGCGFPVRCVQASAAVFVFIRKEIEETSVFFPAAGFRGYSDGKLYYSGTYGYMWTSTPNGSSTAYYLRLYSGEACVYNDSRAYGFSVRCVQASAAVFVFVRKDIKEAFVFFPASGYRHSGGAPGGSGSDGRAWTSTLFEGGAYDFGGWNSEIHMHVHSRDYGFPVRCVQASATVWTFQKENIRQIRFRRESGKVRLCRRGQADSVTRLGRKLSAGHSCLPCAASSYLFAFIKLPVFECLYFYKHFSGYSLFFPASGYRDYNSGYLYNSGTRGYGWTSTPNGSNAWYLYFYSGDAYAYYYYRGSGFPVRCVQASAPVFVFVRKDIKEAFVFFPASGYRYYADGSLVASGAGGLAWSSTPGDGYAWRMSFDSGGAHMDFNYLGRAYGFPVRCVQASAAVFSCIENDIKQIRYRRESGKVRLCRRGRADSVTRLGRKLSVGHSLLPCAAPSYLFTLIKLPVFECLYFYKHFSGYSLFFPASGYRDYINGNLSGLGISGYGWTSSSADGVASSLLLYSAAASMYDYVRNDGFSVRCVQASAAVIVFIRKDIEETFFFFPASGYRNYIDGKLLGLGTSGYGWASSSSGGDASSVVVHSGGASMYGYVRSDGFSVRCVQASATVWAVQKENIKQIRFRWESGKVRLCRRGQADSVTRLGRKLSVGHSFLLCAAPSYLFTLIKLPIFECLYFYKHFSSYFLFFPATGYRFYRDSSLSGSGAEGFGWTSTSSGGYCSYLRFLSFIVHVDNSDRGNGFPVRCVQASATVWAVQKENIKQIRFRRESGKDSLYRRGQADSVTRLGRKLSVGHSLLSCAAPSYSISLIKLPVLNGLYFYKHYSGYSLFFPATGNRNGSGGGLTASGSWGLFWTATPSDGRVWAMEFNAAAVVMYGDMREHGFSVRCVQASAVVFVFIRKDIEETFFFPAAGDRRYNVGSLGASGAWGDAWSSTTDGSSNALFLNFFSGHVKMSTDNRGFGFSVRCVQASVSVFAFTKDTLCFFPASGYRNINDGWLSSSGIWGYGWTSTLDGGNVWHLDIHSGNAYMLSYGRGFGFPVRCVQASATVWAVQKENIKQIRFRWESGKVRLYRRGRADSVTRLGRKLSVGHSLLPCAAPSYLFALIKLPVFECLYFYKHSSGYSLFFPASWLRNGNTGELYLSGPLGYGWSSTSGGVGAYSLCFWSGNVFVDGNSCTVGFSVRCVQASASVFAFTKDTFCFFPAAGDRQYSVGSLDGSGSFGFGWTSTPDGSSNAWNFYTYSGKAFMGSNHRGYGFSVRCVQASAAVFAFTKETFFFFPATGYRHYSAGNLHDSGVGGYVWSSVPADAGFAVRLVFHSGVVGLGNLDRTYGFAVRCVQASATVWALRKEDIKQIRYRRESGKACLCRRGQADSVTRLGRKLSVGHSLLSCAAPSYSISLIKLPVFAFLYFYKHSSGYFLFFPASGFRFVDAKLYNSGIEGHAWTSTLQGSGNAWHYGGSSGSVTLAVHACGFGFPVRCVQASAPVFVLVKETFVFFPAAGYRHFNNGSLSSAGTEGFGWTSTLDSGNVWHLDIHSGNAYMLSYGRGFGFPVRCVQASATVWVLQKEDIKQIRYRRESGKIRLCRRGRADSVTCLGRKLSVGHSLLPCAAPSYLFALIKLPVFECFYFYKHSSGYSLFFPAIGIRDYTGGNLANSGTEGDGWTSVSEGNNAFRLIFKSGYAYVTSVSRACGFPVRCVQASVAGFTFNKDAFVFFPASGYHDPNTGDLYLLGSYGLVWSSTPDGSSNVWNFYIYSGNAFTGSVARAFGLSVRCVQASATVWALQKENIKQIRFRRESGKGILCRRGQADSVTRLGRKLSVGHSLLPCAVPSYSISLIKLPVFAFLYFYKHSSGYFFFFPATGYRHLSTGTLGNSGISGYAWTSTPDGSSVHYLYFYSGAAYVISYDYRSGGFPVRCVQASATVWVLQKEDIKQIRYRRESGKVRLCRRGHADSVTRLECKPFVSENLFVCVAPSYSISLIKIPVFECLYFYKHSSGYFFFFPASGFRDMSDGKLYKSGGEGDGWTSSSAGGTAFFLRFQSGIAHVNSASRAFGLSVRCVQVSAAVWAVRKENIKQIRYRRESGKGILCRRGQADSVTRLGRKLSVGHSLLPCAVPSYSISLIKLLVFECLYFYKYSSGYFYFFPASGGRYYNDGKLYNSGGSGYGWSSTPDGSNAWYLDIWSTNARIDNNYRGYGFPVRCVQASATVWALRKEDIKQIRYRRESGKVRLCRRGQADSVTRLGRKLSAGHSCLPCAASSYLFAFIKLPVFAFLYFYKHFSGYFLFFPAAGYRFASDGSLRALGTWGYGWSSTPNGGVAEFLWLSPGTTIMSGDIRSHGFSVRCVQASVAVFVFIREDFRETSVFFPASGNRGHGDGVLYSVGAGGYAWSSTAGDSSTAWDLNFYSGPGAMYPNNRTYGFPVRCVQVSAAVFVFVRKDIEKTFVFFPATGYRHYSAGNLADSGFSGYGWTSAPDGSSNAYRVSFSSGTVHVNVNDRTYGFPVRCVQASAPIFAFTKDTFCFFPASRVRSFDAGILYNGGVEGDAWASTPDVGGRAWYLYFSSEGLWVSLVPRDYGFPVRCVQASATVWIYQEKGLKQIRYRRESGKARLCRRGRADSVTRLGRKVSSGNACLPGAAPSHVSTLIRILVFIRLCFYEHSRGYSLFFPAAGYRDSVDGRLNSSGAEGNGWASSSTEGNGFYLRFMASLAHVNTTQRAAGLPVRCVQASATVFASYRKYRCKNKCR